MAGGFWVAYSAKLAVVGIVLAVLYTLARRMRTGRLFGGSGARNLAVIESAMLSPHVAVYLLRVGRRHLLIGGGTGGLVKLADFTPEEPIGESAATETAHLRRQRRLRSRRT